MPCVVADFVEKISVCLFAKFVESWEIRRAQAAADAAVNEGIDSTSVGG